VSSKSFKIHHLNYGRLLADVVASPGSGHVINPARHDPEGFGFGVSKWRGVVKHPQLVQHLVSFGSVGVCSLTKAEETSASVPKWVKTIGIRPLLGEWERATAWYGHLLAEPLLGVKAYGSLVSISTRHDQAQRTSYVHHCRQPITAFFHAAGTSSSAYVVAAPSSGKTDSRAQYLRAKDEG
jgi:hypothetical protein